MSASDITDLVGWQRFEEKFIPEPNSGCWLWVAGLNASGYGVFFEGKKTRQNSLAHRWAYKHFVGDIPDGLVLDHICGVRCCVNPDHLEAVTQSENLRRSDKLRAHYNKRRTQTHCARGHPFSGANVYTYETNGKRYCKTCKRESHRRYRVEKRNAG